MIKVKYKIFFIVILFFYCHYLRCQVKFLPEIGINYRPYTLLGANSELKHYHAEFYIAGIGELHLTQKVLLQTKIGYIFRSNQFLTTDITFNPQYVGAKYINQDLILNISLLYSLNKQFQIGIGVGIFHKLNSRIIGIYEKMRIEESLVQYILPNTNILFEYNFSLFNMQMNINYYLVKESFNSVHLRGIDNSVYGVSLGISYDVFSKINR